MMYRDTLKEEETAFLAQTEQKTSTVPPQNDPIYEDLRGRLMYFVEPQLKGVKIHGNKMEGAGQLKMSKLLISSIKNYIDTNEMDETEKTTLGSYAEMLQIGTNLAANIDLHCNFKNVEDIEKIAVNIQEEFLKELKAHETIRSAIIPIGWFGSAPHALALTIKWNKSTDLNICDTYDLAFTNTGDGLEFHQSFSDSNEIYPFLSRAWIEFENVPETEIFDDVAWLINSLLYLSNDASLDKIEKAAGSVKTYFYGSILANWNNYEKIPSSSTEKLIPMQRSGSCTLYSLLAALLYHCPQEQNFYLVKITFGRYFMTEFLEMYQNSPSFLNIITDSFEGIGRNLFAAVASAQANNILQYLEHAHPAEFKHAGLLGLNRSSWITENKESAIKFLENNPQIVKIIKNSVDLSLKILNILERNPIISQNNMILLDETKNPSAGFAQNSFNNFEKIPFDSHVNMSILTAPPRRIGSECINYVVELLDLSKETTTLPSDIFFIRALDIFKRAGDRWWANKLPLIPAKRLLSALQSIMLKFLTGTKGPMSFEDVVLLAHIQLAAWKAAVVWDNFSAHHKLELSKFHPPRTIQHLIINKRLLSNVSKSWKVRNMFDSQSLKMFKSVISELENSAETEVFTHPLETVSSDLYPYSIEDIFNAKSYHNTTLHLQKFKLHQEMFEKMADDQKVKAAIEKLAEKNCDWKEPFASTLFVLTRQEEYKPFNALMKILTAIHLTPLERPLQIDQDSQSWLAHNEFPFERITTSFSRQRNNSENKSTVNFYNEDHDQNRDEVSFTQNLILNSLVQSTDLFYKARHCEAAAGGNTIVNLETWLNFVKYSKGSKPFSRSYFVYLTDRILNLPQFTENSQHNKLNLDTLSMYPTGFSPQIAKEIYESLMALIKRDLETISSKRKSLEEITRSEIVGVIIEMTVILIRFMDRIENDHLILAERSATVMAELYNLLYPFSKLENDFFLSEEDISSLNFVLTQICSISLRNGKFFLETLEIYPSLRSTREGGGLNLHRRTLLKFHWFVTKLHYRIKRIGESVADDQFNYGFINNPLFAEEKVLLEALLVDNVLSYILKTDTNNNYYKKSISNNNCSFTYYNFGFTLEVQCADSHVYIQLNEGIYIVNGKTIADKRLILNHSKFQNYCSEKDRFDASKGFMTHVSTKSVYLLHNFKGIPQHHILVTLTQSNCDIFRKWRGNWFTWSDKVEQMNNFIKLTNYRWVSDSKLYIRKLSNNLVDVEYLLFTDNDDLEPVLRVTSSRENVHIWVANFSSNEFGWILLNEDYKEDKHLESFSGSERIYAKTVDGKLVVIFPGLRIFEDLERPLVFKESSAGEGNAFEILNAPDYFVSFDQNVCGSKGLPGGLSLRYEDEKVLLLPMKEVSSNDTDKKCPSHVSLVEFVPIVDSQPAPQTRLQKLLLAYYFLIASEYKLAKSVLHPANSLHQNEIFSEREITVISWIIKVKSGGPEQMAIKTIAFMHILINQSKFPNAPENDDPKNKNNIERISKAIYSTIQKEQVFFNYLMSIRDISEKYYVHRLFPEILIESHYWDKTLKSIENQIGSRNLRFNTKFIDIEKPHWNRMILHDEIPSFIDPIYEHTLLDTMQLSYNSKQKPTYFKLLKRLLHRRTCESLLDNTFSMALYCYMKQPTLWSSFFKSLKYGLSRTSNYSSEQIKYEQALRSCHQKYKNDFMGIDQSVHSKRTKLESIRNNLIKDLESKSTFYGDEVITHENNNEKHIDDHDQSSDLNERIASFIHVFTEKLMSLLKHNNKDEDRRTISDTTPKKRLFNNRVIKNSKILSKIADSIDAFIVENGHKEIKEIDLRKEDLIYELNQFDSLIQDEILRLTNKQNESLSELIERIGSDSDHYKTSHTVELLNRLMHQRKVKTFSNLYSCYLSNSLKCFQQKFSQLSSEECITLKRKTYTFYSRQVLLDHLNHLKEITEKFLASAAVSSDDLEMFCDELKKVSEFKSRHLSPVILNFEFRSRNYRLRSEQVKDIELLTSIDTNTNNYTSIVIQRMMAAGKTLVLGTISVITKALNHNTLSILVPPSSLYQNNTTAMQEKTYQFFKRKGKNFIFPRFSISSDGNFSIIKNYLDHVTNLMRQTMSSGDYLILNPDSLHSFLNSYLEMLNVSDTLWTDADSNDAFLDILQRYAIIYNIFKQKGSIILDEIDMTMDPRKELNFPTVEKESYNMLGAALMADIIEFTLFDSEIKSAGLDILANNQASLTAKAYENCREIIFRYIERELNDDHSIWRKIVYDHGEKVVINNSQDIMKFLRNPRMDAEFDWIKGLYSSVDRETVDTLIIIKLQLYKYFEDALQGTVNQNFGDAGDARPTINFAVPYVAANTPSPASIFADRWETLNKTLLMTASVPCTHKTAKQVTDYLKNAIIAEAHSQSNTNRLMFNKLIPEMNPAIIDPDDEEIVSKIHSRLRERTPAAMKILFSYVLNSIIKEMQFNVEQITSNALNMTSMFSSVQGYSGTIDNVNILPTEVVSNALIDHLNNEKNNGGIALKLIRDSKDGGEIVRELKNEIFAKPVQDLVHEMVANLSDPIKGFLSAIIDTGAFFKTFKNRQVAEAILVEMSQFEVAIYYDEASNQLEFIRKAGVDKFTRGYLSSSDPDTVTKTTQVSISKRFTFYDQRHITGSDILQPKQAHALVTIAPRVLLRDILQGTMRMRQFMTTQRVHLITTESTREFYYSKVRDLSTDDFEEKKEFELAAGVGAGVTVEDIITLGSINEDEKQRIENEKLAFVKIDNEIRSFVLSEISSNLESSIDDQMETKVFVTNLFKSTRTFFVRSIREDPISWLQREFIQDSRAVLKKYYNGRIETVRKLMTEDVTFVPIQTRFRGLEERIEGMISEQNRSRPDSLLFHLPDKLRSQEHVHSSSLGTEIQMELLSHTIMHINLDQFVETRRAHLDPKHFKGIDLKVLAGGRNSCILEPDDDIYVSFNELFKEEHYNLLQKPLVKSVLISGGHGVAVSKDLVQLYDPKLFKGPLYPIFTPTTREGSHLLVHVLKDKLGVNVFLVSIENARRLFNQLKEEIGEEYEGSQFWLCDLSGRVTISNSNSDGSVSNVLDFIPEAIIPIFEALIFNGSLTQILSNPILEKLYRNRYLKGEEGLKERAIFLLSRMKVLMNKQELLFEASDRELFILNTLASGGKVSVLDESADNNQNEPFQERESDTTADIILSTTTIDVTIEHESYSAVFEDIFIAAATSDEANNKQSQLLPEFIVDETKHLQPETNGESE